MPSWSAVAEVVLSATATPPELTSGETAGAAPTETRHGTCVRWRGAGLLLLGGSGTGKSSLAIRLIGAGAWLVADDLVRITRTDEVLWAGPVALPGLLELRGHGIIELAALPRARLHWAVWLGRATERWPAPATEPLLGLDLPALHCDPEAAGAVARLGAALLTLRQVPPA